MSHIKEPHPTPQPAPAPERCSAIILAAGRGERMRPLTDTTPKPLLPVQGKPLMQWSMEALVRGGFGRVVINTAWLGEQIAARFHHHFGLEPSYPLRTSLLNSERSSAAAASVTAAASARLVGPLQIAYSHEGVDFGGALETAGGIARALALLCPTLNDAAPSSSSSSSSFSSSSSSSSSPSPSPSPSGPTGPSGLRLDGSDVFWVLAGDVFIPDFEFDPADVARFTASGKLAHIWLVPNPEHNPRGDFGLGTTDALGVGLALNLAKDDAQPRWTYSTIGLYRAALFQSPWCTIAAGNPQGTKAALAPLLRAAMNQQLVSAQVYTGTWFDIGTPERLAQINQGTPTVAPHQPATSPP